MNKDEERKRIGSDIATLRKESGMTQQDVSERTGILRPHIVGRPKQDGKPRKYIVPDDVHEYLKSQGGGEYITLLIRGVMAINRLQNQGG